MKSNIIDWNNDMKIRLLKKMSNWHLKHFDKESGDFAIPLVYNWSGRSETDYNGNKITSPNYVYHELDYRPMEVIYTGDTKRFGGCLCYRFGDNEYKVVRLPYHFTAMCKMRDSKRLYPFKDEIVYDDDCLPMDYHWCCKIEKRINEFRGRNVYRDNIKAFAAVVWLKRAYEMYVFLDDYKYRIQRWIDICTEAYKSREEFYIRSERMRQLERAAYDNFWTADEIEKKRDVIRNEFHYVHCPYSFPIIKEIEDAMNVLKNDFIYKARYALDIKRIFEPIFVEVYGQHKAEHILYRN